MKFKWRLCVQLPGSVLERNGLALPHCLLCVQVDEALAAFYYLNLVSWDMKRKHHETTSEKPVFVCFVFQQHRVFFLSHDHSFAYDKISRLSFCVSFWFSETKEILSQRKEFCERTLNTWVIEEIPRTVNEGKSWIFKGMMFLKGLYLIFLL